MTVSFSGKSLTVDGREVELPWPVLTATEHDGVVFVLLDPDSYLTDSNYKVLRRQGARAIRNLLAFNRTGQKLWEAEIPEPSDYYYKISSIEPLVANSYSSYRCEINPTNGTIARKEFLK